MRTTTTAQRNTVSASMLGCWGKLEIQDGDLTWRDVSASLSTPDWFNSATLTENIDQNTASFQAVLLRDTGTLSLAPLMAGSTINRNSAQAYAPMLNVRRMWRLSEAVVAAGATPGTGDWKQVGQGYIDTIEIQDSTSTITITGRGMEAAILDTWIPAVRTYCSNGATALEVVIQQLLDDNMGDGATYTSPGGSGTQYSSGITLYTPAYSPTFMVNQGYRPATGNLMDTIIKLAQLAGMVVRYMYDANDNLRFTLLVPPRNASTALWTIDATEYLSLPVNKLDVTGVRNYIELFYIDPSTGQQSLASPAPLPGTLSASSGTGTFSVSQTGVIVNGATVLVGGSPYTVSAFNGTTSCTLSGNPTFSASPWTTSTSITEYGKRYMRVDVTGTVPLNATQAQAMADAMRSDLELPALEQQFLTYGFWFAQLYDYGKLAANGVHYDTDQTGGVTQIAHKLEHGGIRTTVDLKGKPAGRYRTWLTYEQQNTPITAIDQTGPNLTVTPTPGTSSYSIAWSGNNVLLSIDGGTYSTPGASPITVPRPTAGNADHVYAFQGSLNGQTVTDSVTIPALAPPGSTDTNTITPDLTVTPGTQTPTTEVFTATAVNPSGGAVPTITVTVHNTTATGSSVGGIAADTPTTIPSGETVTVARPAWNSLPASVTIRATLGTGNGAETIGRSILNQDKLKFGPNLTVTPTPGANAYSIAWSGDSVLLSIDGGAYGTPGASPISVTRNPANGADHIYAFQGTADAQTVTDSVVIPAIGSVNVNTVTPDLTVTPAAQTTTTEPFLVTAVNPSGGVAPTITVTLHGTTGSGSSVGAIAADTATTIPSGEAITVMRAGHTSLPASATFRATLGSGNGAETISRTILNQVSASGASITTNQANRQQTAVTLTMQSLNLPTAYTWALYQSIMAGGNYLATQGAIASGSNSSNPLPATYSVTAAPDISTYYSFVIRDPAGGWLADDTATVLGTLPAVSSAGTVIRSVPNSDGNYAATATNATGTTLSTGVTDSSTRPINKFYAKSLSSSPDSGDSIVDGATYGMPTFNQRTGGGRGYTALDSGNVVNAGYIDFSRGYTNKSLANIPDDGTSNRYAVTTNQRTGAGYGYGGFSNGTGGLVSTAVDSNARSVNRFYAKGLSSDPDTSDAFGSYDGVNYGITSLNQRTGGGRGYTALDSGNIVNAGYIDFARSYTNKSLANIPDSSGSNRYASTSNQNTGGDRAYGGFTNATGGLASTAADSAGRAANRFYAKPLSSSPDSGDSISDGVTYGMPTFNQRSGGGYGYTGLDSSGWQIQGIRNSGTIGEGVTAQAVAKGTGAFFNEPCNVVPTLSYDIGAASQLSIIAGGGVTGDNAVQFAGEVWARWPLMAYDPSKLYRIRARVKQTANPNGVTVYIGISGIASNGTSFMNSAGANSYSGQFYFAANGASPGTGYTTYTGWFKGTASSGNFSSGGSPQSPSVLYTGVAYICPLIIANYQNAATGNTLVLDLFTIDVFDEDGSYRTYSIANSGGNIYRGRAWDDGGYSTRATDSGGYNLHSSVLDSSARSVNRFYAKALTSDPDSIDAVIDGSTYERTLGSRVTGGKPFIDFSESINLNKHLGNIADYSTGNRYASSANQNTGGDRGYGGFTNATGGLVSTAVDSGARSVNKFYAKSLSSSPDTADSIADGATYGVATFNQQTGGDRGYAALDSGNVVAATSIDFSRSYTNKSLANIPDSSGSNRYASSANQNTGGDRGYGGFSNSTGGLVSTAADSAGRAANRFFAKALSSDADSLIGVPDDTSYEKTSASRVTGGKPFIDFSESINLNKTIDYIADGVGSPIAGGKRGTLGLDGYGDLARNIPSTISVAGGRGLIDLSNLSLIEGGAAQNLIENPGFELAASPAGGDGVAQGWGLPQSSGGWTAGRETASGYSYTGSYELYMAFPPNTYFNGNYVAVFQRKTVSVLPGDVYTLSAWVKSLQNVAFPTGTNGYAVAILRVSYSNGSITDYATQQLYGVSGNWLRTVATFTIGAAPSGLTIVSGQVILEAVLTGSGTSGSGEIFDVRFDGVELIRASRMDTEIQDGVSYRRPTVNEATGGGRGYAALDPNNRIVSETTLPMTRTGNIGSSQGGYTPVSTPIWNSSANQWEVSVVAHTLHAGASNIAYNSGIVMLPALNTAYYIYCIDPTYAGGAVTWLATTTPQATVANEGTYLAGTAVSGSAGGGGTPPPSGGGGGGGGACFAGDTLIALADGTTRRIDEIMVGDQVVSIVSEYGTLTTGQVTGVQEHDVHEVIEIATANCRVTTTPEHPFFLEGRVFAAAGWLYDGDPVMVLGEGGVLRPERIVSIERKRRALKMYNFTVKGWHTYVAAGFAVHNIKMQ